MSEQEKTLEALRKNEHDWAAVGTPVGGPEPEAGWEDGEKLAIVYEDGSYEVAWLSHNLATIVRDYARTNGYGVVEGHEVVQ